jgi:hypothetical protein
LSPDTEQGERTYRWPDLLPGGAAVLFTVGSLDSPNDYDAARVVAYRFDTGQRRVLVEGANMARFVPPGTLVYSRTGVLFAAAFDPDRLEVIGQPAPVLEGVAGDPSSGATYYAVARDGTLAVVRGAGSQANRRLALADREGGATRLPLTARGRPGRWGDAPAAHGTWIPAPALLPGRHTPRFRRGRRLGIRRRRRRLGLLPGHR